MAGQGERRFPWRLGLVLLAYLLITVAYGVMNPLFEAPDENWHYFTVQYIADHKRLPMVPPVYDPFLSQEAAQPPLYYLLGALLIAPIDTAGAREQVWPNPFAWAGDAAALANYNQFIHTPQERWPWRGYALAAHVLRLFSTLLGLGTIICVYGCAGLFFKTPGDTDERSPAESSLTFFPYPLLAAALVAFWPQFNFVHASVTNDALITFLCAAALWQLLKLWRNEEENSPPHPPARQLLLLGLTIALAVLSKNAGTLLFVYALGFVAVLVWQYGKGWPWLVAAALQLIIPVLLLSSWLWWRNWTLYGDPTAAAVFVHIAGGDRGYTLWQVLAETPSLWNSLFALFGWFNVRPPAWVLAVWQGIVVLGIATGGWSLVASRQPKMTTSPPRPIPLSLLLFGWLLLVYAGLVLFMLRTPAAQGRLLFPALVVLVLGVVSGFRFRVPPHTSRFTFHASRITFHASRFTHHAIQFIPLLGLVTTVYCVAVVIPQAYARPRLVEAVPDAAAFPAVALGNGLSLVGAEVHTQAARPGDPIWLTLYWQAETTPTTPPEQVVEFFGLDLNEPIGRLHSYHGRGMYPATLWPPGSIVEDRFAVRLHEQIVAPVLAAGYVRLDGQGEGVLIGTVKVVPTAWPPQPESTLAIMGEGIRLHEAVISPTQASPGERVMVQVIWSVAAAPLGTLTTFVHLGEPTQPPLAAGDNQPRQGRYPTHIWAVGEVITDEYTLFLPPDLPPGRYPVGLGMYDAAANLRLPLTVDGQRPPDDRYFVGWLEVK